LYQTDNVFINSNVACIKFDIWTCSTDIVSFLWTLPCTDMPSLQYNDGISMHGSMKLK